MAVRDWQSLCKKIQKFNTKYPEAGAVCMAVICNRFVYTGSEETGKFAALPSVQNLYRSALLGTLQQHEQGAQEESNNDPQGGERLDEMLKVHVFDMDTDMLRSILSHAAAPPRAIGAKDSRRGWYKAENCPAWWAATGIPFQSVNQSGGCGKKLDKLSLMSLVEQLQHSHDIKPAQPMKMNKTAYISLFQYDEEAMDTSGRHYDAEVESGAHTELDDPQSTVDTEQPCVSDPQLHVHVSPSGMQQATNADDSQPCCSKSISTAGLNEKKKKVKEILDMKKSWEERSLLIMRNLDSWDNLWGLSDFILSEMPILPTQLASSWKAPELVKLEKYKAYGIPLDVGERSIRKTTSNGNCIFNAISIALYGDETMALPLKLGSVLTAAENLVPFTKYLCEEYAVNLQRWLSSFALDVEAAEDVESACRNELVRILQAPYSDGTLLHLHIVANYVKRPIHQHCAKDSDLFMQYKQVIYPFNSRFQPSAIHLVWVPSKPKSRHSSYNHVVPAVCSVGPYGSHIEECAFQGLGTCKFIPIGFDEEEGAAWVECTLCGQWVHKECMGVTTRDFFEWDDFPCGCDRLVDGEVSLKSQTYYDNLKVEKLHPGEIKEIIENTDREPKSLRNFLFKREGHHNLKSQLRVGRFGPFREDFIDDLIVHMRGLLDRGKERLVPDLYLPEVCLFFFISVKTPVGTCL